MTRPLAECRGCRAPIVWITMRETGAAMPCDPDVIVERLDETAGKAASNVTLVTEAGVMEIGRRVDEIYPGLTVRAVAGRVPHWATCAKASEFKSKRGA